MGRRNLHARRLLACASGHRRESLSGGILFILVLCDVPILFPEAGSDDINSRAFIERGASWRVRASAAGLRRRVCVSSPSIGDEDPPATLTRSAWGRGIASSLNSQFLLTVRAQP